MYRNRSKTLTRFTLSAVYAGLFVYVERPFYDRLFYAMRGTLFTLTIGCVFTAFFIFFMIIYHPYGSVSVWSGVRFVHRGLVGIVSNFIKG